MGADIDPRVAATLPRLRGSGRQLLALRSYLRSRQHLGERWSWTDEEVAAYEGSAAQAALLAEIGKVRAAFESANPGYSLWVNPQLRTLDRQIHGWNANESVAAAASLLEAAGLGLVSDPGFPAGDVAGARQSLQTFLGNHRPQPTPTIAAPGLSPHGQMHAVDFQISREGVIVAGTSAAAIATEWEGPGWAARLQAAVSAASIRFAGPLEKPREPWHYTYVPDPGIPTAALPHDASIPNSNNR